jgi:short chain dehydrogenase
MSLAGKQIVIIGGASGIGLAVAVRAAAENAEVTIVSSSQVRVDAAVKQLSSSVRGVRLDATSEAGMWDFLNERGVDKRHDRLTFWRVAPPRDRGEPQDDNGAPGLSVCASARSLAGTPACPPIRQRCRACPPAVMPTAARTAPSGCDPARPHARAAPAGRRASSRVARTCTPSFA